MEIKKLNDANHIYNQITACKNLIDGIKDKRYDHILTIAQSDYYNFAIDDLSTIVEHVVKDIDVIVREKLVDVISKKVIDLEKDFENL